MTAPTPITIIGTGGHARVVLELVHACGGITKTVIDPAGDTPSVNWIDPSSPDSPAVQAGTDSLGPRTLYTVAIGDNTLRQQADREARATGAEAGTLVHPEAHAESSVSIGPGSQICIGAILCTGVTLGRGVIVNSGAIIEHECIIGDHAHVCPGAALAGRVRVGPRAMIGLGARVIQGVSIGQDAVIGAGAVVLGDVPDGATVAGIPARAI